MNKKRATAIALGVLFGLVAYPTLIFLLWMRDQPIDYVEVLKDGGLYFFATAATGPLFFAKLLDGPTPSGIPAIPFYSIPVIVLALTMLVYASTVADGLGAAVIPATNPTKLVWLGLTLALCAVGYRCGFEPGKT